MDANNLLELHKTDPKLANKVAIEFGYTSYDEAANTITWDLTKLASGTGFSSPQRETSFQIALTPTIGQIGTAPVLVTSISLTGRGSSTNEVVTATNNPLTTRTASDPTFIQGDDIVVK